MSRVEQVLASFKKKEAAAVEYDIENLDIAAVPAVLRALAHEVQTSRVKLAQYEKIAQAEKLVAEMESRGLVDPSTSRAEKVAAILNSGKDLTVLAEAMDLDLGDIAAASVSDETNTGGDVLTQYLTGNDF